MHLKQSNQEDIVSKELVLVGEVFATWPGTDADIIGVTVNDRSIGQGCQLVLKSRDGQNTINLTVRSLEISRRRTNKVIAGEQCGIKPVLRLLVRPEKGWAVYAPLSQVRVSDVLLKKTWTRSDERNLTAHMFVRPYASPW